MTDQARLSKVEVDARRQRVRMEFELLAPILFDLDIEVQIVDVATGREHASHHLRQSGRDVGWLPRGRYRAATDLVGEAPGTWRAQVKLWADADGEPVLLAQADSPPQTVSAGTPQAAEFRQPGWRIRSMDEHVDLAALSWNRGHDDWFFTHFDHAARVIIRLMLDRSLLLRGRILDVGCGDGMTDLGVFLRCQPQEFIGIDPSRRYRRLPEIARQNHIPAECLQDARLRFEPHDGNAIPYPDDHFDVVLSWGSLEHIAGGYEGTLAEIRRVLKADGLLFCHPGLYYGPAGNHLGEFFDDPWIHLKLEAEELRGRLLAARPEYLDRCGEFATPEAYWQWFTELNPITVEGFERQLRALGFEPWRVALRQCNVVEYTPELQRHSFVDLATAELYLSAWNRK